MTIALTAPLSAGPARTARAVARPTPAPRVRAAGGATGQLVRYAAAGTLGTGLYLALYVAAGWLLPTVAANIVAWLVSTVATNEAQRRLAFGAADSDHAAADATIGLITSAASLVVSSLALTLLDSAGTAEQVLALVAVTAVVGLARFLVVRAWFARRPHHA